MKHLYCMLNLETHIQPVSDIFTSYHSDHPQLNLQSRTMFYDLFTLWLDVSATTLNTSYKVNKHVFLTGACKNECPNTIERLLIRFFLVSLYHVMAIHSHRPAFNIFPHSSQSHLTVIMSSRYLPCVSCIPL